jgi:hypothetical protein
MHHLDATRILSSLVLDLLLMLLVATGMVLHSLRYRSQTVTGLAFLLGYATVAASHFESAQGTVVFSLSASAVLALGLVVVTTRRHWAWLELAGLIGVLANHFLWLSLVLPATRTSAGFPLFLPSAILILFYWLIFRAAYLLRRPLDQNEDRISSLTAVLTGAGILGLLKYQSTHPEWAFRTLLVLGTLELLLGIWSRHRRRSAFVVLTTVGAVLFVAAVPFQFRGVSWPILWLVEAHVLALCGLRLGEPVFRRLGLLAGFGASLVLAIHDVLPLALFRLQEPDPGRHPSLTVGLALAAALFWLHAELYPRRWPEVAAQLGELESIALQITSWLGLAAAAAALWVVLPAQWIVVGWLALAVFVGLVADWKTIKPLALQAEVLAAASLIGFCVWTHDSTPTGTAKLITAIAVALFYLGMRRQTTPENSPRYVAPAYSSIASIGVFYWIVQFIPDAWRIVAFTVVAITIFETGRFFLKGYLRWQGHVSAILGVLALQVVWVEHLARLTTVHGWFALSGPELVSLLGTAALGYWVQEKTTPLPSIERKFGLLLGACATLAIALWLPILVPSWGNTAAEPIAWAALATVLLLVAFAARRRVFQLHGIAITLFAAAYSVYLAVTHSFAAPETLPWWQSNLFRISLSSAILLAALPVAFLLRKLLSGEEASLPPLLKHPEQWFFFVPFGMMIVTLAAELRSGNITVGWSLLGLGAFVFALIVGERSFRLGGLSLLLLSVAKILLMDVWTLSPADRYTTLIVMGCALLLVSFLYTRFRETFRKYL